MKKLIGSLAVAALLIAGAQVLRRHQNNPLVSPAERQALRDAPNDDLSGQLPQLPKPKLTGAQAMREASAAASMPSAINLSDKFIDGSRNQGHIGDCHTFAAVALLEAAYNRQYKQPIRFSETDLFTRAVLVNGNSSKISLYQGDHYPSADEYSIDEGGWAPEDAAFAIRHGIASDLPYATFAKKYTAFLGGKARAADLKTDKGIARDDDEFQAHGGWLTKLIFNMRYGTERQYWMSLQKGQERQFLDDLFKANKSQAALLERNKYKDQLKDFHVFLATYPVNEQVELSGSKNLLPCDLTQRKEGLLTELIAKRPAAVSMLLPTQGPWNSPQDASIGGGHAFVIIGYETTDQGLVFQTRNSWGTGNNYLVLEKQLCRVRAISTVLIPGEKPQPGWMEQTADESSNAAMKGAPVY